MPAPKKAIKVMTIVGTRPELIKLCHAHEVAVSTGGFLEYILTQGPQAVEAYLAECHELGAKNIAQRGQMQNVERGVIQETLAERTLRPIGLLAVLVEDDAEVLLQQAGEADAGVVEQLRRQHGVEQALRAKLTQVPQQADVEIASVHQQVLGRQFFPKRGERERGEHIHQEYFPCHEKLEQTHPRAVVEHVVRLRIERDLIDAVEGGQQRRELVGLFYQRVCGQEVVHLPSRKRPTLAGRKREMRKAPRRPKVRVVFALRFGAQFDAISPT